MAKQLTITALCDLCMKEEHTNPESQEYDVSINGVRAILDLCEDHAMPVELVRNSLPLGAKPEPPEKRRRRTKGKTTKVDSAAGLVEVPGPRQALESQPESHPCPLCEHESASRPALGQHTRLRHGLGFTQLREQGHAI